MPRLLTPQPLFDTLENLDEKKLLPNLTFADEDYQAALSFLKQYNGNQSTFEAYRREVERLLQWAWLIAEQSILKLKYEDLEAYLKFCMKPPQSWIGLKRTPRFIIQEEKRIPNPIWRPFVVSITKAEHQQGQTPDKTAYQLSQKSIREIFTVLGSFYNYLVLAGSLPHNPIALIRQKNKYIQKQQSQAQIMRLSEKQWHYCFQTAQIMAAENPLVHERTLFIITAMYLMYLRISEFVATQRWTPLMSHFHQHSDGSWWFKIVGKGNKLRTIAVSQDMLNALKHYRVTLGLSPLPSPNEQTPLMPKIKGFGPLTSTRHIRSILEECFKRTSLALREDKLFDDAHAIGAVTVHWLRHTGISDDVNKRERPILHVRDDAGHTSVATTEKYSDVEWAERYRSAKDKKTNAE